MKKYEMDPTRTVGATEWTRDVGKIDGRKDRQTEVKPIYPPPPPTTWLGIINVSRECSINIEIYQKTGKSFDIKFSCIASVSDHDFCDNHRMKHRLHSVFIENGMLFLFFSTAIEVMLPTSKFDCFCFDAVIT